MSRICELGRRSDIVKEWDFSLFSSWPEIWLFFASGRLHICSYSFDRILADSLSKNFEMSLISTPRLGRFCKPCKLNESKPVVLSSCSCCNWRPFVDNLSESSVLLLGVLFKNSFWFTSLWSSVGCSSGFWSCNLEVDLDVSFGELISFPSTFLLPSLYARFILRLSEEFRFVSGRSVGDWLDVWTNVGSETFGTFFFYSNLLLGLLSFNLLGFSTRAPLAFAICLVFD